MPPRKYAKTRRAELEAETRERIMKATVELHAVHGALATSYAMIAARAGVSPQTVYNHYPSVGQLIHGCTSHVAARAPVVTRECFAPGTSEPERLRLLVKAVYRQLAYMAPWLRLGWGEAEVIPELRQILAKGQSSVRELVKDAIGPTYRSTPEFLDAAMLLLDYPAWKHLRKGRTQARAAALAGDSLVALLVLAN